MKSLLLFDVSRKSTSASQMDQHYNSCVIRLLSATNLQAFSEPACISLSHLKHHFKVSLVILSLVPDLH